MTDKIKPPRHPSQAWIDTSSERTVQIKNDKGEIEEFEIDDAILIDVNPIDMGTDIPEPHETLPENLRAVWKGSPSPEILEALSNFTTDYMIEAQFDQTAKNAYPKQVRNYVSEVEKTVEKLQSLADLNPLDERQQTIIRHMTRSGARAIALFDLVEAAEAFKAMAIELRDSMGEPTRGSSGTQVPKARKRLFASRLHEIFKEHNLPTNADEGSLMPVVLGLCLEAAGEKESRNPEAYFSTNAGNLKTD